MFGSPL